MGQAATDDPPPLSIETEAELDEFLTRPRADLIAFIQSLTSPLVVLGASGKMGPSLAVLARRAAEAAGHPLEVIAVSRFSDPKKRAWLQQQGVSTIKCDLLERAALAQLPPAQNVVYMVGLKFGTAQNPALTWAINTLVPALVAERYAEARLVGLSTGNVYPLSTAAAGGSVESDPLTPQGEYANAAVGRERIFEFFARRHRTRLVLLRLFYAVELRYGVLRDLADKINAGKPIDLANAWFNCIWQGDANEMVLRSLALASDPPTTLNLTSTELFRVRTVAERLGQLLDRPVRFAGQESQDALVGNSTRAGALLGQPPTSLDTMLKWTAAWVQRGGGSLGKPTHFEVRNGRF